MDVYAIGVVCFYIWFRQRPFKGLSLPQLMYAVVEDGRKPAPPWPPATGRQPPLPEAMTELLGRCWERSPLDRPTMGEVATKLRGIADVLIEDEKGKDGDVELILTKIPLSVVVEEQRATRSTSAEAEF